MKTSKKILSLVAFLLIVLVICYVFILRNTVRSLQAKNGMSYKSLPVGNFERLDFSAPVLVRIKQGKDCTVEYASEGDSVLKPSFKINNGTLTAEMDSAYDPKNSGSMYIRITMPSLTGIKGSKGAEIQLENYQCDSLNIFLDDGCVFKGKNNTLKHFSAETSGKARIEQTSIM